MKNARKTIGNICLIGGIISFALAIICLTGNLRGLFPLFCMLYAFGIILGIILRIGDFFKWRGRMLMQGMQEASVPSTPAYTPAQQSAPAYQPEAPASSIKFCRHCGKVITKDFAFCPACGEKI